MKMSYNINYYVNLALFFIGNVKLFLLDMNQNRKVGLTKFANVVRQTYLL